MENQAHILLVEDEENLLDVVKLNLELEGYTVDVAVNGKQALEKALTEKHELILLDVMLPLMDGFEVCKKFREKNTSIPVLFLTAKGGSEERVNGLKIGADDYLVKPFNLEELLLRVKILLNRNKKSGAEKIPDIAYEFSGYKIDFNTYDIFEKGVKKATLTRREILLLKLLTSSADRVVSREEILDKIWGEDAYPSSRTIDNYILAFRKYFEKNPKEPRFFHSIRGVGYKFTP